MAPRGPGASAVYALRLARDTWVTFLWALRDTDLGIRWGIVLPLIRNPILIGDYENPRTGNHNIYNMLVDDSII